MKLKILCMSLSILGLTGCSSSPTKAENPPKKALVVYFSWGGNTRAVAENIKEATKADIFEVLPETPYTTDRDKIETQAENEVNSGYQPPLKELPSNLHEYDVIFVGSPCWFRTMAPPIATFMATANLSGKTIVPFMTHGGNQLGNTVMDMKKLAPEAIISDGLPIHERNAINSMDEVKNWLSKANLINESVTK